MATTTSVTPSNPFLDNLNKTAAKASQPDALQDRFLKLLITQMQNQDPLNPMDNAEVTTQLAQISTVSGIEKLNQAIADMSSNFTAAQSLQAGTLIGRGILAPGNALLLAQGGAVGGVQLAEPADAVTVTIRGSTGEALKILNLGPQDAGTSTFHWDGSSDATGQAGNGAYTFDVIAMRSGKKLEVEALGYGQVQSVTIGADQLQLNTVGLGQVALGLIKQIL